ncbi:VOC family protein [Companilactobacillus ginsenosidimutans]|uniref:VOC domain-containing protein n=1 Tax=Companilactobacillus ginsenosidimutans TaxID=1007676 RepID=A0A0H4QGX5_9LACO|nr:VOC family protein [Companilactobacillus ginsenosidimutans]AKP66266.1 hypothetical protein ABM34_01015 [Companilactobacillus ginsenosidimutans]
MIKKFELMLYVNDVEKVSKFWQDALNAKELAKSPPPDGSSTVKHSVLDQVNINLFNIDFIKKYSPMVSLEFPSIMLMADDLENLHEQISKYSSEVSDISEQSGMTTFNFADPENNHIAIGKI